MNNLLFKKWNDFSGWIVFLIAAFVYGMTIEPTASFWDCPEFISCAEKLQVGHPPGAPFYMLVGNLFTQFASEASQVSWLVNFLNALLSAGCILFLFWSITRLVRSLIVNEEQNLSTIDVIVILGSGFVGALAYTFSDTFWFSAVEGEVYAFSSFLTALVFWMILRWQDESDSVYGDRWIILIAYIIGLSIGVHLLNLLCIPAIVLVFYYQKYHAISFKGVAAAIVISGLLIVFILFVYIPGIADMVRAALCQCVRTSFPYGADRLFNFNISRTGRSHLSFPKTYVAYFFMLLAYAHRRLYHLCGDTDSCQR